MPDAPPTQCPTTEVLDRYNSGTLADDTVADRIEAHVTTCAICQTELERLASGDEFVDDRLRGVAPADFVHEPDCRLLEMRALAIPQAETVAFDEETDLLERDRYQVVRELGRGGFGRVCLARDSKMARNVAIKFARHDRPLSPADTVRWEKEARALAAMKHPGVVVVYDVRTVPNGGLAIIMEYAEGKTVGEVLEESKLLDGRRAVDLMQQAAAALAYVHRQGIVHRDFKPSNLVVDESGRLRLVDFGVAFDEDDWKGHEGEVAGTYAYMSPEQLTGSSRTIDGRSDIWSAGVVLYEMLTGEVPFRGEPARMRDAILEREPKPPRQLNNRVPARLERICLKCLQKQPAQRYSSASELESDLRRVFPSKTRRAVLGTIAAAAVIAPAAWWLWPAKEDERSTDERLRWDLHALKDATKPFDLLSRPPVPEPTPYPEFEQWAEFDGKKGFLVCSHGYAAFACGRTAAADFHLTATISKFHWLGMCGLFFGRNKVADSPDVFLCNAILLQSRGSALRLTRYVITFGSSKSVPLSTDPLAEQNVEAPKPGMDGNLELRIHRGVISKVAWNGNSHDALAGPPRRPPALIGREAPPFDGYLGVINIGGCTAFKVLRFLNLNQGEAVA